MSNGRPRVKAIIPKRNSVNTNDIYDSQFERSPKTKALGHLMSDKIGVVGGISPESGIPFGQSKYDVNIPVSQLGNLDEVRASKQSFGEAMTNGFVSRALSIGPKVGAGFAYVGGSLTGDINQLIDNPLANAMEEADEGLRHMLPVYGSKDYNSDSILSIMGTQKFWADDFFDGLAFMTSAFIPAGIVGKAGKLMNAGAKMSQWGLPALVTAYNTVSEAGFEANDTKKVTKENLMRDGMSEEMAEEKASLAASNTFKANAGVLLLSNFIQSKFFMGGFGKNVSGMRNSIKNNIEDLSKITPNVGARVLRDMGTGVVSEGLWEEGMQTAIQKYEERMASSPNIQLDDRLLGYAEEWADGFNTTDGQKSMILGALIGAPMGGFSGYSAAKQEAKDIKEFGESWKKKVDTVLDVNDQTFKDRINSITDENGDIDLDKSTKAFYQIIDEQKLFSEGMAATVNNDEFHDKFNKEFAVARYLYPFVSDTKHFESTDEAVEYAMARLEDMSQAEGVDKESFAAFKTSTKKIGQVYKDIQNDSLKYEKDAETITDLNFINKVNKTLFYEAVKRETLESFKHKLSDKQQSEIDNLIEDSKKKSEFLLNSKEREKIKKRFVDTQERNVQITSHMAEIRALQKEIEDENLTEEEVAEKQKEINNLTYDIAETKLTEGSGRIGPLDITQTEQFREGRKLGIKDSAAYKVGMSYKKRQARDTALKNFREGTATEEDVYNAIVENTNESAPLNKKDEAALKEVAEKLREKDSAIDRETLGSTQESVLLAENEGIEDPSILWPDKESYEKDVKNLEEFKKISAVLPKVEAMLEGSKFENLTDNLTLNEKDIQGIAADEFLNETVDPVIKSFDNNKEGFSDINSVDNALKSLDILEDALESEKRVALKESALGKKLIKRIEKYRKKLNSMLKVATENNESKKAADLNSKVFYGKMRSLSVNNEAVNAILDKYIGDDKVSKIMSEFTEDNYNYIHIEKIAALVKSLDEESLKIVIDTINQENVKLSENVSKSILEALEQNGPYSEMREGESQSLFDRSKKRFDTRVNKLLSAYRENPASMFNSMLTNDLAMIVRDGVTRAINIYESNNNILEFENNLKTSPTEGSGSEWITYDSLVSIVEDQVKIESLASLIDSINTTSDTLELLNNEKTNAAADKKAGVKTAPSRQQRIAIFELMRWFGLKNKSNGLGSFAYMKGLAGTGKTTIVSRLFLKFLGIREGGAVAIGNNESSSKTINESLGLGGEKTIDTISKEDLNDDVKLLIVDEIGAVSSPQLNSLISLVKEVNDQRVKEDKEGLKVLVVGDPTQLTEKTNVTIPLHDTTDLRINQLTMITPLTIPYRSDINSVLAIQELYHMNMTQIVGETVVASNPIGNEAKGVHAGTTRSSLVKQLNAMKDNKRSKVLVVGSENDVKSYTEELGDSIPGLEIMTYNNVQGRTFDDVFIDINPSIEAVLQTDGKNEAIAKRTNRNKIMYTATSRATSYIFILDHTGTFKNKTSDSIFISEESNIKEKSDYQEEHRANVNKDILVMKDQPFVKPKDEKEEKPEDQEDVEEEVIDEEIIEVDEDENVGDPEVNEMTEEEEEEITKEYSPETDDIHNVKHTTNLTSITKETKAPFKKGDKVFYVKTKEGKNTHVNLYVNKTKDSYYKIGVLDNDESVRLFGKPLKDILNDDTITTNVMGSSGRLRSTVTSATSTGVVAVGTVNATPIPLTYVFKKKADTGVAIIDKILNSFKKVFEPEGFSVNESSVEILTPQEVLKRGLSGVRAGVPYLFVTIERKSKGKPGTIKEQYVKLTPRKVDKVKDSGLIDPLIKFVEAVESTEEALAYIEDGSVILGTKQFNELIKALKKNFKVSEDQSSIEEATTGKLSLTSARMIVPALTQDAFDKVLENSQALIEGFYGIGNSYVKMTEEEFNKEIIENTRFAETDFNGKIYYREIATGIYHELMEDGRVQTLEEYVKKDKTTTLVPTKDKYLSEKILEHSSGTAQISLNALAKNNATPGGVNIRVKKYAKSKKTGETYTFISGKSLLSSGTSRKEYVRFLRSIYKKNGAKIEGLDIDDANIISLMETNLIELGLITAEELKKVSTSLKSSPLTSNSLRQAMGFKEDGTESSTLFLPIDRATLNEFGKNLDENKGEVSDFVNSHFDKILPTTTQVKIDKTETVEEEKPAKEVVDDILKKAKEKTSVRSRIKRNRRLEKTTEAQLGKQITQEEARKLVRKTLPGISDEEIQFVVDSTSMSYGKYDLETGVITFYINEEGDMVYEGVAKHESFHKIYNERFSHAERVKVKKAFNNEFGKTKAMDSIEFEEFVAEKYQEWIKGDYAPEQPIIKRMFGKLRDLFRFIFTNKYYIETVFRDVESGKYKPSGLNTVGGASTELRTIFKTTESLKIALGDLKAIVSDLNKDGINGYPISKYELKNATKIEFYHLMKEVNEELEEAIYNYEIAKENGATQEQLDELMDDSINELSYLLDIYTTAYKNYNEVFKLAYPNWDVKNLGDVTDIINEEDLYNGVNIFDDIVDWDKVNLEGKVSSAAKRFMSDIIWDSTGDVNKYVNQRYAYITSLEIMNGIQDWNNNFVAQIEEILSKEVNPKFIAVGNAMIDLYLDVTEGVNNGNAVRSDGKFLNDSTFVYLNKDGDTKSLTESTGINILESEDVDFTEIKRGNDFNSAAFIDRIIEQTRGKFSKEDLFNLYGHHKNSDLLKTLMSNLISQRERDIKITVISKSNGQKVFKYMGGKGRISTSTYRDDIKSALSNLKDIGEAAKISSFAATESQHVKTNEDKVEFIKAFMQELGLSHLVKDGIPVNEELNLAYEKIIFTFVKPNIFNNIYKNAIEEVDDADSNAATSDIDAAIAVKVNSALNSLLNSLSKLIGSNTDTKRATSVKSASGENKYIFVLGNQAMATLNNLKRRVSSGLYKGTSKLGLKQRDLPDHLVNDFFQANIFVKGTNKIYAVEDYDGTREDLGFGNISYVTEYKDEQYDNYMERAFSAQFVQAIADSSSDITYSQNLYTVSNKPSNISVSINPLDRTRSHRALKEMVIQLSTAENHDVKNGSKYRIVNANQLALAIGDVIPGSVTKEFAKGKFSNYVMSEEAFKAISNPDIASKVAWAAYERLMEESKKILDDFINAGVSMPVSVLSNKNLKSILDQVRFKEYELGDLRYKRRFDWATKKVVVENVIAKQIQFKETNDDVLARINKFSEKTYDSFEDAVSDIGSHEPIVQQQVLVEKEAILPIVSAFVVNDYINSNQLTQLISGSNSFFKSSNDLTKRLSGSAAPGVRGFVNDMVGMPEKTNVAILEDLSFTTETGIRGLMKEGFGLTDLEFESIKELYGKDFESTDGQGFMLPERYEEIVNGFGLSYNAGHVLKPAYFHIDSNGVPRMLKYSSIVLSDDLVNKFPVLRKLRETMRKGGSEKNISYGEVVFASGNKVGTPNELTTVGDILNDGLIKEKSGFEIHNTDYRLQLNPIHDVDSTVASPTQLGYFLNTMENNIERAETLYEALATIIRNSTEELEEELSTYNGLKNALLSKLKGSETNRRTHEIFSYFTKLGYKKKSSDKRSIGSPWNYPGIAEKIAIQLSSFISKNTVQVRFPGAKLILQSDFGTSEIAENEELQRKADSLNYKLKPLGNKDIRDDILYAEVIVPKGMLPKEHEELIERNEGEIPEQFLYSDMLGFRLPSSELHSAIPLKVVGFYDTKGTNVIIAPKDIVALHGSDYDVDALYAIRREYEKDQNGNLKNIPIGYKKSDGDQTFEFNYNLLETIEDKEVKEQYLKNLIVETFLKTISIRTNRVRMAAPISMIRIKKDIERILNMMPESKKSEIDSSLITDRQKTHASSFEALSGTGIFANGIKVLAYMQRAGDGKSQPIILNNSERNLYFVFNGEEYIELDNSQELWEDLDAFLNSAIDNVNEQDLPSLNMTKDNIKAYIALRGFGVDLSTANNLFAQEFVSVMNRNGRNGAKAIESIFNELYQEGENAELEDNITNAKMISSIKSELSLSELQQKVSVSGIDSLTKEELAYRDAQYMAYFQFSKALEIGDQLSDIAKFLSVIKQLPSTRSDVNKIMSLKKSLFGEKEGDKTSAKMDISEMLDRLPHVNEAYKAVELINDLFTKRFYRYNEEIEKRVKKAYSSVYKDSSRLFDNDPEKNKQRKTDEFIRFLLTGVQWDPEYSGFFTEKERETKKGVKLNAEDAFLDRLFSNVDLLKKSNLTRSNLFLSGISVGTGINAKKQLNFAPSANMDYIDTIDYENAFDELVNYDIVDGKVVKFEGTRDQKETMGYSMIQKDFMRYLVLAEGLMYTKNNYTEVLPLRLSSIFQRRYEHFMDSLLSNEKRLDSLASLFKIQLVVNNPSNLKFINKKDKRVINKDSEFKKYIVDTDTLYADFTVEPKFNDDGTINTTETNREFPEFVIGPNITRKNGTSYKKIYIRVNHERSNEFIAYQEIAKTSGNKVYSVRRSKNISNYDQSQAFRSDVRNIAVANPKSTKLVTNLSLRIGSKITLTSFNDVARQDVNPYIVDSVKQIKRDGKDINQYTLKRIELGRYAVGDLNLKEEFVRIYNENPYYKELSTILKDRKKAANRLIYKDDNMEQLGVTSVWTTSDDKIIVATSFNSKEVDKAILDKGEYSDYLDTVILHEEIHRYTHIPLAIASKHGVKELKKRGFTEGEITFVEHAMALYSQYMENPVEEYKDNITDVYEFVAYALTDSYLMGVLDETIVENKSILQRLIDILVDVFGKQPSMYRTLQSSFKIMMDQSSLEIEKVQDDVMRVFPDVEDLIDTLEITDEDAQQALRKCNIN